MSLQHNDAQEIQERPYAIEITGRATGASSVTIDASNADDCDWLVGALNKDHEYHVTVKLDGRTIAMKCVDDSKLHWIRRP